MGSATCRMCSFNALVVCYTFSFNIDIILNNESQHNSDSRAVVNRGEGVGVNRGGQWWIGEGSGG